MPRRTRTLLLLSNVSMVILIAVDLFYLTDIIRVTDLPLFTLVNLLVMGLGLWSFKVKRDLRAGKKGGEEDRGPE